MNIIYNKSNKLKLNRSELAVPASRTEIFLKASKSNADIIFLDLEDSVAYEEKDKARTNAIQAINDIDWKEKTLSVRINSIDTDFMKKDLQEILTKTFKKLDLIMIPKVSCANDIKVVDKIVTNIEKKMNKKFKLGYEIIIENALGLVNLKEIVQSSNRNESLHFGAADFSASIGAKNMDIGSVNNSFGTLEFKKKFADKRKFYINNMWQYMTSKILVFAKAFNLRAIDCPYGEYNDTIGFNAHAKSSYSIGFDGKMVIHPNQVDLANKIYSPSKIEINEAKEILNEMRRAGNRKEGAITYKGRLLDIVSIKQAKNVVKIAEKIYNKKLL